MSADDKAVASVPVNEDWTEEKLNPQPPVWPQCDTCKATYVLRRCYFFMSGEHKWAWQRDCEKPRSTCKTAFVVMMSADGPVES